MKKRLLILPLLAGFALASCDFDIESLMFWKKADTQQKEEQTSDDEGTEVKDSVVSVSVVSSKTSYQVGDSVQLSATVEVTGNTAKTVTWSSSNTGVATVSSSGSVSFVAAGQVTITATSTVDTLKKGSVTFTITEKGSSQDEDAVVSVSVSSSVTEVELGADPIQLSAIVTVTGNAAKTVTWSSSDESVATVSESGLVSFVAVGESTITATSTFDTSKKGSVTFTVKEKGGDEENKDFTVTLTFSAMGYDNGEAVDIIEDGAVTVSFDKGTNSNAPKYYDSGTAIRVYGGNSFTISTSSDGALYSVTFDKTGSNELTASNGSLSGSEWTAPASGCSSVTFTVGGTSGHIKFKSMVITGNGKGGSGGGGDIPPATDFPSETLNAYTKELGSDITLPEFSGTALSYDFIEDDGILDIEVGSGKESAAVTQYQNDLLASNDFIEGGEDSYGDMHYISTDEILDVCAYNAADYGYDGHVYVSIAEYYPIEESDGFPLEAANAFLSENGFGFTISESEAESLSALAEVFSYISGEGDYGPYFEVAVEGEVADSFESILKSNITSHGYSYNSEYSEDGYSYYENSSELSVQFYVEDGYSIILFY